MESSFLSSTPPKLGPSNNKSVKTSTFNSVNDFPESVLHNILSCLDMKEVVQTSAIAKRWRNLWKFQPVLYFNHSCWNKSKSEFMEYVDKALCVPKGDLNIRKFYLDAVFYCKEVYVCRWMAELVRRRAEEIYLKIGPGCFVMCKLHMTDEPHDKSYELPDCLFTSPILVFMLQVESNNREFTYQLPKTMRSAPHLKCLQLASAMLPKGDPDGNLVLTCPVLEKLEIVECDFAHLNLLTISTPKLKYLLLENSTWGVESSCKIKLNTPNLTFFMCKGAFEDFIMENVSSLFCAYIFCSSSEKVYAKRDINLLRGICNATTLVLFGWWAIEETSLISSSLLECLPHAFHNLKVLKITWIMSRIDLIVNLLKKSPYLESLHFGFFEHESSNNWGEDLSLDCSFDHLKSIEIDNYNDSEEDFKFLEFLLRRAMVLEYVRVIIKETISDEDLVKLRNKLEALLKASSTANLQIVKMMTPTMKVTFKELWTDIDNLRPKVTVWDGKICRSMGSY